MQKCVILFLCSALVGPKSAECTLFASQKCAFWHFCVPSGQPQISRNHMNSLLVLRFCDFRKSVIFALACARFCMPREGELTTALAQAAAPNARPGGPSAGGSEGRRVPPAKSLGYPFGNIIFEKSCPFGLGIPTPNCMNSPGIMFPKGCPSEIAGIYLWKHNFLRNPFHSEWGFPLQIEWISQKSCFLRGTPADGWEGEPER